MAPIAGLVLAVAALCLAVALISRMNRRRQYDLEALALRLGGTYTAKASYIPTPGFWVGEATYGGDVLSDVNISGMKLTSFSHELGQGPTTPVFMTERPTERGHVWIGWDRSAVCWWCLACPMGLARPMVRVLTQPSRRGDARAPGPSARSCPKGLTQRFERLGDRSGEILATE
jgi:hypothetical protein